MASAMLGGKKGESLMHQPAPLTLEQIKTDAPFPWKTALMGKFGNVVMLDATSKQVPLFHITRLSEIITEHLCKTSTPITPPSS
jgi:hypothetical protein